MTDRIKEIKVEAIMECLGQTTSEQKVFLTKDIVPASAEDVEEYFPFKISHSIKNSKSFKVLGIQLEEIHFLVNDKNKIEVVFFKLDNQDVVEKLKHEVGPPLVAAGSSFGEDVPFSIYSWNHKNGCIDVELEAYTVRATVQIVRDRALIVFNKCDPFVYVTVPEGAR